MLKVPVKILFFSFSYFYTFLKLSSKYILEAILFYLLFTEVFCVRVWQKENY